MSDASKKPEPELPGEVRHLPVQLPERAPPAERKPAAIATPLVAATGGLLAGIATMVLVRLLRRGPQRRLVIGGRGRRGRAPEIAATRSFLVDVHMLKR